MVQDLEKEYRGYDLNKVKKQKRTTQIVTYISALWWFYCIWFIQDD
jgi:hypothetical protein